MRSKPIPSDVNQTDEKYDETDSDGNGKNYRQCRPCSQTDTVLYFYYVK